MGDLVMSSTTAFPSSTADGLRRLYFVRFLFAAAWAATFAGVGGEIDAASVTLLLLYPAFDVAAAVFDYRATRNPLLFANMGISTAAAVGLAVASTFDVAAVLRVWGAWAIVAGALQLFVALKRRGLSGQVPMILSGSISVLAGGSFLARAGSATSMKMVAGYAALGGLFFLVSAVRLLRARRVVDSREVA
jgi:uncharacterized membrane protein HdeD (DUF308 family)